MLDFVNNRGQPGGPAEDCVVIFCIGGITYADHKWSNLTYEIGKKCAEEWNCDGIDLDIENSDQHPNVLQFMEAYKRHSGGKIITCEEGGSPQFFPLNNINTTTTYPPTGEPIGGKTWWNKTVDSTNCMQYECSSTDSAYYYISTDWNVHCSWFGTDCPLKGVRTVCGIGGNCSSAEMKKLSQQAIAGSSAFPILGYMVWFIVSSNPNALKYPKDNMTKEKAASLAPLPSAAR